MTKTTLSEHLIINIMAVINFNEQIWKHGIRDEEQH